MRSFDLVCIGSGPAGEKAATQAAFFGKRCAVIEAEDRPGGAMVNTGTIPSKTLRETALLYSAFRRRPMPGVNTVVDPSLSIARFMARRHLVQIEEHDRIEASFDTWGVETIHGRGRIHDAHTVEVSGRDGADELIRAEHILVAVGSRPFRPTFIDFSRRGITDADTVLELQKLPSAMVIIGGGVIGSEYASIFGEIGVNVTLLEPRGVILPFIDDECRALLEAEMAEAGITVCCNAEVRGVETQADGRHRVITAKGEQFECDAVLWALGRSGNTTDLGLEGVGIVPDKRGQIAVDSCYRTCVSSIWAAGDCIGPPALASTSMEQGRLAACHMFGIPFKEKLAETVPMGIYTIPPVASVGLSEKEAREQGHTIVVGRARYRANPRGRMLGDSQGLIKLVFDREDRLLLGAAIVGAEAAELIHLAQAAIATAQGIDYFISACFNYPTLSELYRTASYYAVREMAGRFGAAA